MDSAILRPYGATKRICGCYYGDECEITIVSGMPEGIDKSGYVNRAQYEMPPIAEEIIMKKCSVCRDIEESMKKILKT